MVVRLLAERVDRLVRELRLAAFTDPLTGLLNRRTFEQRLGTELARARRTGEAFALVLADVDGFKAVNDRLGHAAGDAARTALSRTLVDALRTIDDLMRAADAALCAAKRHAEPRAAA